MEKQRFEEAIRRKLDDHASTVTPGLWEKIDNGLGSADREKTNIFRIRYGAVAAMIALVVISISIWPWEFAESSKKEIVAGSTKIPETEKASSNLSSNDEITVLQNQNVGNKADNAVDTDLKNPVPVEKLDHAGHDLVTGPSTSVNTNRKPAVFSEAEGKLEPSASRSANTQLLVIPLDLDLANMLAVRIKRDLSLAYRIADAVGKIRNQKREPVQQTSWLAVGYASGTYQQQVLAGTRDAGSSRASAVYYGRNFGRLALFTGLAFAEQEYNKSSDLASGTASARKVMSAEVINSSAASSSAISATNTYLVNTQKRYLSVPFQAGWFVVDRKIKGMLTAGITSDYFLSSTLSDVSGVLQTSTVHRGSGVSYAGWVFSGIAGTEWSMKFSDRYQVALTPSLRYGLTPVYRKDFLINGKSYAFDIGVRFRYFFDR